MLFMPKYNNTMQALKGYSKVPLAKSRVRQLLGTCELALDQLKGEIRKVLNGTLKADITEWWLKKIETKVRGLFSSPFPAVAVNIIAGKRISTSTRI